MTLNQCRVARRWIATFSNKKFFFFVLASGASVPVNLGSRILFSKVVPFEIAVVFSHFVGMATAFVLTRTFVFKSSRTGRAGEFYRFALVNMVSLGQTWVVSELLLRLLFVKVGYSMYPELTAHAIGLGTAAFTSFLGHRHYSFKESL